MSSQIAGKKVAILIANGFDENFTTDIQRALIKGKATLKTIAPENGVVNGWQGTAWGHYFPVDCQISETLGSDFDMLIIPGGERAVAKLKNNLHTRRIINHFVDADKPIAAIGAGVALLALAGAIKSRDLAAPAACAEELKAAGALIGEESLVIDGNIVTSNGEDMGTWVEAAFNAAEQTSDELVAA